MAQLLEATFPSLFWGQAISSETEVKVRLLLIEIPFYLSSCFPFYPQRPSHFVVTSAKGYCKSRDRGWVICQFSGPSGPAGKGSQETLCSVCWGEEEGRLIASHWTSGLHQRLAWFPRLTSWELTLESSIAVFSALRWTITISTKHLEIYFG